MTESGGELPPTHNQGPELKGAEVIDFVVAQRKREGKSLFVHGRVGDRQPPANNVRYVYTTPEGITIWKYTAIDPDDGIELLGEKPLYTTEQE